MDVSLFFAFWMFVHHNPHQDEPYYMPIEYSIEAWKLAQLYDDVEPWHVMPVIVAEHGGGYPYPADSIEYVRVVDRKTKTPSKKPYAYGLMQVSRGELRKFNWCNQIFESDGVTRRADHAEYEKDCGSMVPRGVQYTKDDLLDWRSNMDVGVWNIHRIKHVHATKRRCTQAKEHCEWKMVTQDDGTEAAEKVCEKVPQRHVWHAHYRCGGKTREMCQTQYRQRLEKRFAKFDASWMARVRFAVEIETALTQE